MNIIIDQPKLVSVVKLYLTKNFSNLNLKTSEKYPESSFYVNSDNNIIIKYNPTTDYVWIIDQIWSKLESLFYLKYNNIQLIMKDWLEEHYGLEDVIPIRVNDIIFSGLVVN